MNLLNLLKLIPVETSIAIIIFVIIPMIAVAFLRFNLHQKLQDMNRKVSRLLASGEAEGLQPEIVTRLKNRYEQASQKLEQVNTIALIDSAYQQELISLLRFHNLTYDKAEAITKIIPNLLLAFGLFGTFFGITNNLTNISAIVTSFNSNREDISRLVLGLEQPLRDMGVAFATSLFGLFFGSLLTVLNTLWNTTIVKYQLISGLEDYLDNIYKPTVEGNTRLDKAIDRMVQKQEEFLTRFHENVARVLETSFGRAAKQIAEECGRINKIAENVYTNFQNSAGTISTSANTFEYAAKSLESQTQNITKCLDEFKSGVENFKIAANQIEQNNIVQNLDRILAELNSTQTAFTKSANTLENSLEGITHSNQTAAELARQVYDALQASSTQIMTASENIGAGSIIFQKAAHSLEHQTQTIAGLLPQFQTGVDNFVSGASKVEQNNIVQNLDRVLTELNTSQQAFSNSTQTLETSLVGITSSNQEAAQLAQTVYQTWQNLIHQIESASTTIDRGANTFSQAANSLATQSQTFATLVPKFRSGITSFVKGANKVENNNIIANLDRAIGNLATTQTALSESSQTLATAIATNLIDATTSLQNTQSQLTQSTIVFGQAIQKLEPVANQLTPTIASLDRTVNTVQDFSREVATLSQTSIETISTKFDRQQAAILNSTKLSVQGFSQVNQRSLQELRDFLGETIQKDRQLDERFFGAIQEYLDRMNSIDRDYLLRLTHAIEKLNAVLSRENDTPRSGFLSGFINKNTPNN